MNLQSQAQPGHDQTPPTISSGRTWQAVAPFLYMALLALGERGAIKLLIYLLRNWYETFWLAVALEYAWYFSVVSLVGLSFVLGPVRWPLRVLGGIIGMAGLEAICRLIWIPREVFILLALPHLTFLISLLAIGRCLRLRVVRADLKEVSPGSQVCSERTQLSISDLLFWTAGFAVLFWVTRDVRLDFWRLAKDYRFFVGWGAQFGAVAICAVWAVLEDTRWSLRPFVIILIFLVLAEINRFPGYGLLTARSSGYLIIGAQFLFVGAGMLVLRAHGYRLVRVKVYTKSNPPKL